MEKFLSKWLNEGLINKNQYLDLLNDYKIQKEKTIKTAINVTIYIIGALLLGLGIILFISANNWILEFLNSHNILKVLSMFFISSIFLYGGYILAYEKNKFQKLGNCLIFLSTLSIGGLIALLGQIYNLRSDYFGLYFLWFLCIYPLAFIFKNMAINILSCVIFIFSTIFFFGANDFQEGYIWGVYVPFILGALFYIVGNIPYIKNSFNDFSNIYKKIALFAIFILLIIQTFSSGYTVQSYPISLILPVFLLSLINLSNYHFEKDKTPLLKLETGFIFVLIGYILTALYMNVFLIKLIANILIIFIISAQYYWGHKFENEKYISLATKFLSIYLIVNYIRFGSQYLEGASFFLIGGLILTIIGIILEKNKKQRQKRRN